MLVEDKRLTELIKSADEIRRLISTVSDPIEKEKLQSSAKDINREIRRLRKLTRSGKQRVPKKAEKPPKTQAQQKAENLYKAWKTADRNEIERSNKQSRMRGKFLQGGAPGLGKRK